MKKSVFTSEYARMLDALRAERETRHMTQKDMAKRLSVTQAFVSKCERGERRIDIVELSWFSHAMGLSLVEFIKKAKLD